VYIYLKDADQLRQRLGEPECAIKGRKIQGEDQFLAGALR